MQKYICIYMCIYMKIIKEWHLINGKLDKLSGKPEMSRNL